MSQNEKIKDIKELEIRIEKLEAENSENKAAISDLEYLNAQMKKKLNNLWHKLKVLFFLSLALVVMIILMFTTTPPIVVGLWIIFGTVFLTIALFVFFARFTFTKFD